MALQSNNTEGFKEWLAVSLEELCGQVVIELMQDWISPLLVEVEQWASGMKVWCEPLTLMGENRTLNAASLGYMVRSNNGEGKFNKQAASLANPTIIEASIYSGQYLLAMIL